MLFRSWEKWKLYEAGSSTRKVREVNKDGLPREYKIPGTEYEEPPPWEDLPVQSIPVITNPTPYVTSTGTVYVGLREVEVPPKENKWIKEATELLGLLYLEDINESLKDLIRELLHMPVE